MIVAGRRGAEPQAMAMGIAGISLLLLVAYPLSLLLLHSLEVGGRPTVASYLKAFAEHQNLCLLYTSPSPRDLSTSRMPSSA